MGDYLVITHMFNDSWHVLDFDNLFEANAEFESDRARGHPSCLYQSSTGKTLSEHNGK